MHFSYIIERCTLHVLSRLYFNLHICTGCSLNIVFFPRILENLPPLPRQHSAAIGCTKNYQPIGVTVHSHCVENFEGLHSDVGEGGVAVNCKKTIFPEHPVVATLPIFESFTLFFIILIIGLQSVIDTY